MAGYVIKSEDMQVYTNENRSDRLRYTLRRQTVPVFVKEVVVCRKSMAMPSLGERVDIRSCSLTD